MAFNPDQYLQKHSTQGGFNPDAYLAAQGGKPAAPKVVDSAGNAQAFIEGMGDTLTFGNLPTIQAAVEKITPKPSASVDAKLRSEGFDIRQPEQTFVQTRDQNIRRQEKLSEEFPTATTLGKAGGLVAGTLATGGLARAAGFVPAATRAGRAIQAAKGGAVIGALQNPGTTEGELNVGDELEKRAVGAVKGAAIGAVIQPLAELVTGPLAQKASDFFKKRGARSAIRALGPTKKEVEKLQEFGRDTEVGSKLLDDGLIPRLSTPARIAKRLEPVKKKAGKEIDKLINKYGEGLVVDGKAVADQVANAPDVAILARTPGAESLAQRTAKTLDTLRSRGTMSLKETQQLRRSVDNLINFSKRNEDMRGIQAVLFEMRSKLRDAMNASLNQSSSSIPRDALLKANKSFSDLARAESILEGKIARDTANRAIGLTDTISGGSGAVIGATLFGPPGAIPGAVVGTGINKFGRTFGAGLSARANQFASNLLKVGPEVSAFAANNPIRFQILVNKLSSDVQHDSLDNDPMLNDPQILTIFKNNPQLIDTIQNPSIRDAFKRTLNAGRDPGAQ